jgi:hypothetical protein
LHIGRVFALQHLHILQVFALQHLHIARVFCCTSVCTDSLEHLIKCKLNKRKSNLKRGKLLF